MYFLRTLGEITEKTVGVPFFRKSITVIDEILLIDCGVFFEEVDQYFSNMYVVLGVICSIGPGQ